MTGGLYRAQILLERKQHAALTALAQQENRSLSEKVREIIGCYLAEHDVQMKLNQELDALANLSRIREETARIYGVYPGDPIAEARVEREAETDQNPGLNWKPQ